MLITQGREKRLRRITIVVGFQQRASGLVVAILDCKSQCRVSGSVRGRMKE
jgi:hypothetical protein